MPVKLIRCDVDIMKKNNLTPGTHVLGRGPLLEVFDKRVSRKHAEIVVNNDSIVVKSLHHNPVFFSKRGCSKVEALTTNSTVMLCNSDKIGFLPTTYWFEIIVVNNEESTIIPELTNNNEINEESAQTYEDTCNGIEESAVSNVDQVVTTLDTNTAQSKKEQLQQDQEANKTASPAKRRRSASEDTLNFDSENHNCEFDAGKKVKLEQPDSINARNPSATTDQNMGSSSTINQGIFSTNVRERCYYGERCYRRNPVHLVQYSHPKDSDWGTGEKGECPNGAYCTKNDIRHWDTHNHPPGTTCLPQMQVFQIVQNGRIIHINPQFNIQDGNRSDQSDGGCCDKNNKNP